MMNVRAVPASAETASVTPRSVEIPIAPPAKQPSVKIRSQDTAKNATPKTGTSNLCTSTARDICGIGKGPPNSTLHALPHVALANQRRPMAGPCSICRS